MERTNARCRRATGVRQTRALQVLVMLRHTENRRKQRAEESVAALDVCVIAASRPTVRLGADLTSVAAGLRAQPNMSRTAMVSVARAPAGCQTMVSSTVRSS